MDQGTWRGQCLLSPCLRSPQQPDLNWENPAVREDCIDMINWWLDRGLGGFRIDAIMNLKKRIEYGVFPADGPDGLVYIGSWILNQPGIETWLKEIDDKTFRPHNALTVAEADVPPSQLAKYIGPDGYFRMVFDFSYTDIDVPATGEWFKQHHWTVTELREKIFSTEERTQQVGWGARYLENHDQPRSVNKYLPAEAEDRRSGTLLATLFMMLHGTPFIYQGQEIGMSNIPLTSVDQYEDVATHDQYRRAVASGLSPAEALHWMVQRSRDNSRTPMQWDDSANAGFTTAGVTPWFPVNPNYTTVNVAAERADAGSVLHYYRKLIALRRTKGPWREAVVHGTFVPVDTAAVSPDLIVFQRVRARSVLVAINFSAEAHVLPLAESAGAYTPILANVPEAVVSPSPQPPAVSAKDVGPASANAAARLVLPPYAAVVLGKDRVSRETNE
ncbi:alpha-amylase family glycosyl hydrolase [Schleiferilactobacillus shenzhenensis]